MPDKKRRPGATYNPANRKRGSRAQPVLAITIIIILVSGLTLSALNIGLVTTATPQGTPLPTAIAPRIFPTVPPGGTELIVTHLYYHPSGVFTIPQLSGWDISPQNGEATTDPLQNGGFARAETTFINGPLGSVIHAFAEKAINPTYKAVGDLDKYYDVRLLTDAWKSYTGGWTEQNRRVDGDTYVINFQLVADGTYLARQISQIKGEWLLTLRLVVPNNNPQLLDQLQAAIWPRYQFWPQALSVPINWRSIADYVAGYEIKFPADWNAAIGTPGNGFSATGKVGIDTVTLSTKQYPGITLKSEDEARAWVKNNIPSASILRVVNEEINGVPCYSISFSVPDADGNPRSSVIALLNGSNNVVYAATIQSTARGVDYLDDASDQSPIYAQIRKSFFVLPAAQLIPTAVPTITPTPTTVPVTISAVTPAVPSATTKAQ